MSIRAREQWLANPQAVVRADNGEKSFAQVRSPLALFTSRSLSLEPKRSLLLEAPPRTIGGMEAGLSDFLRRAARIPESETGEHAIALAALIDRHLGAHRTLQALRAGIRDAVSRGAR